MAQDPSKSQNPAKSDLVLYNYFRSSTSYRVRIALNLKKLDYTYVPVHLLREGGEQHKSQYRALNPQGEVPTLVHKGQSLAQSLAILVYLDDLQPTPPLFPKESLLKAQIWQFCENINSFLHPLSNLKVLQKLEIDHGFTQGMKNQWVHHWYSQGFKALEVMLEKYSQRFSFGPNITAADVLLVPALFTAERFKVDLEPFPLCRKINKECLNLEAFQKAHPSCQPDTPATSPS
jgi:maleylacetoacetate isomerase